MSGYGDWWLQSGTTSTDGFVGTDEIKASAVTTAKIADSNVTSEKASTNLLTRTIVIPIGKMTASSSGGWSSTYVVYRPLVPMQIQRIAVINTGVWENCTGDEFVVFRNSSSCVAGVSFSAGSTARAAGTRTAASSITNALITADTDLTVKTSVSTCSVSSLAALAIDYITTG